MDFPVVQPMAEHSLMVEFGDRIEAGIHAQVLRLDRRLAQVALPGVLETVPAYAALMIRFDPLRTDLGQVSEAVWHLIREEAAEGDTAPAAERVVDICYDGDDFAPDLAAVAAATGLTTEAVINAHLAGDYSVFLYGFAPGYAYMAGVPKAIQVPRKPTAIRGIPKGSLMIAGPQCIVTSLVMPAGWAVIGRSPTAILTGDPARPFLFDVGDRVRFRRITRAAFDAVTTAEGGA